ncbi:MAG: peptidoglycan DD-metalloendopeptidase family protein [Pseudomonadales bacterium]
MVVGTAKAVATLRSAALALLLGTILCACATPGLPPVADRSPVFGARPGSYEVRSGDTLYSIAWRYGLDTTQLAGWNGLAPPYLLAVGQRLRLTQAAPQAPAMRPERDSRPAPRAPAPAPLAASNWRWPVDGAAPMTLVQQQFTSEQPGMTFRLAVPRQALAAASGEVVYAGNGLGGYAQLIILRHAGTLLSAYSFDGRSLVVEGQRVKVGRNLADISTAGTRGSLLYFELRRKGSPIDPRRVIR